MGVFSYTLPLPGCLFTWIGSICYVGQYDPIAHIWSSVTPCIRQYDSTDTGHSDNVNIAAEHQEPVEVLSQLDNTSNSPVYGEYKCC